MSALVFTLIKVSAALGFGLNLAGFLGWVERKQSAVLQDRIGANRAEIFGLRVLGLFHPIADAIKMMTKEDFVPPSGHRTFHTLAPAISLFFSLACLAALPFGGWVQWNGQWVSLQPLELGAGAVFMLGMLSVGVHGVVMAGWASGSNYALLGGLRGAAQMVAYEVTLALTFLGALFIYGTLDLQKAVEWQSTWWGIVVQPLGFILFMTAAAAETKRAPFDIPEGESEIVGYFVEYSGMKFGMFLMTDFIESVVLSGLGAAVFLGGWQVPGVDFSTWSAIPAAVLMVTSFSLKVAALLFLLMQIRWTLPRFRFDQVLDLGWKLLLPLSLANLFVTMWAVYLLR